MDGPVEMLEQKGDKDSPSINTRLSNNNNVSSPSESKETLAEIEKSLRPRKASDLEILVNSSRNSLNTRPRPLRKSLIQAVIILLLLVVSILLVTLITRLTKQSQGNVQFLQKANVCMTHDCVSVAARIIASVNFSVDPCQDFHKFSCGNWEATHFLPESKTHIDAFVNIEDKNLNILKKSLDSLKMDKGDTALGKLHRFYQSCRGDKVIESRGKKPIIGLIQSLGSCPLLNATWNEGLWDFNSVLAKIHRTLFASMFLVVMPGPLFNSFVKPDDINSSQHIIEVRFVFNMITYHNFRSLQKCNVFTSTENIWMV